MTAVPIDDGDYIDPADARKLRVFTEPVGDGQQQWTIDGRDGKGGYTEAAWEFDSFPEAVAHLRAFAERNVPHLLDGAS